MVVGFNHNFSYKGQLYHVQTEDSGVKNPHIITLLYRGGTILASKKTSYADIIKIDNLDAVVEDLMKTQHREMLRLLKQGEFDSLLGLAPPPPPAAPPARPSAPPPVTTPTRATPVVPDAPVVPPPPAPPVVPPPERKPDVKPPSGELSLDDIILSYMVGEDRKQ